MEEIFLQEGQHFLIRARFIFHHEGPPLIDGAVEIRDKNIVNLGLYRDLKREASRAKFIDFEDCVILPILVNSHVHLELSPLRFRIHPSGKFTLWLRQLLKKRSQLSPIEIRESSKIALRELLNEGTGLVGEVTNTALTLDILKEAPLCAYIFQEILSFQGSPSLKELKDQESCIRITYSAHSPYTVSPLAIQAIKSYNQKRKKIFCIHCAESPEEIEFLKDGTGHIANLLKERGRWSDNFVPPGTSPVKYLDTLGVLNQNTLLIHCVHLRDEDFEILSTKNVWVCLCPRSNLYTGVGLPDLPRFLKYKIKLVLGTDSLASNDRLSIFEEIRTLLNFYPQVSALTLLEMATLNGTKLFGFENQLTLKKGSLANFLVLSPPTFTSDQPEEVLRSLILSERKIEYRFYAH